MLGSQVDAAMGHKFCFGGACLSDTQQLEITCGQGAAMPRKEGWIQLGVDRWELYGLSLEG